MMRRFTVMTVFLAGLAASTVLADAPGSSLRPEPRPEGDTTQGDVEVGRMATDLMRPRTRPAPEAARHTAPETIVLVASRAAVLRSIRPEGRPEDLKVQRVAQASAVQTQPAPVITQGVKGALCGVKGIDGVKLAPIAGRIKGCGVAEPVKVTSVDGVLLTTPAVMDCTTAQALNTWVVRGAKPSVGRLGGGIGALKVAAHYSCRTRNNQKGRKISEHGKGHAIDISAIILRNGAAISVLNGWRDAAQGKVLKAMHKAACGPFGTVLGPNANRFHQDHFHFDTARYRSGSYCR